MVRKRQFDGVRDTHYESSRNDYFDSVPRGSEYTAIHFDHYDTEHR